MTVDNIFPLSLEFDLAAFFKMTQLNHNMFADNEPYLNGLEELIVQILVVLDVRAHARLLAADHKVRVIDVRVLRARVIAPNDDVLREKKRGR
jgi:hypothetical protein